jgi:hypothetical protein
MLIRALAIFFLINSIQTHAWASTRSSAASSGSDGSVQSQASSALDHLYLNYFGTFNGPGLTSFDNTHSLDNKGLTNTSTKTAYGHINFDSEITAAYLITKDIGVGPVVPFIFYPTQGYGAVLGDLGVKAFDKHLVSTPNLGVYANLILQVPSSDLSKANQMDFAIKTTPSFRYYLRDSRFAVGAWTEAKAYLGVKDRIKSFKLYADPYLNYQLTGPLSLNLGFEIEADHFAGVDGAFAFKTVKTDLQPGLVYMISPKIILNPFIQFFTYDQLSFDRAALSATLTASL